MEIGDAVRFLVPTGTTSGWNSNGFDDSSWTAGTTGIGYDDTVPGYNPYIASDIESFCRGFNASVYLRIPFTVNDPAAVTALELQVRYDDGFAAYLNGQFLADANVPGSLTWNSDAPNSIEANLASNSTWDVSSAITHLVSGANTLAIQMMNQHVSSSSDFLMLPRLEVTRTPGAHEADYDYFTSPTPGAINNTAPGEPSGAVTISEPSGVKTATVSVTLSPPMPGVDIRYTLDGTAPTATNTLYSVPLEISDPARLRARAFESGKLAGPVAVADYAFLDPSLLGYLSDVPVIVMDNFGAGAYPNKGRSNDGHDVVQVPRQANVMSIFEPAGTSHPFAQSATLETRSGCRVRGSSSSLAPRKSLSVEFWNGSDADLDHSPFGMPAEADWVLYAPNPSWDHALIHNPVAFGFGKLIGALTPEFKVVVVFQNTDGGKITSSDMNGVYVFMEKIERGRMGLDFDRMDDTGSTGGWMIGVDRMQAIPVGMPTNTIQPNFHCAGPDGILSIPDDEQDSGGSQSVDDISRWYHSYLNFESPDGYEIVPAQRAQIQSVARAMDVAVWAPDFDDPATGYATHLDSESWARYYATHNFAKNQDMIVLSTFIYRETPNAKLKMGPIWDVDRAFTWKGSATSDPFIFSDRDWYQGLFADSNFEQILQDIWQEARATTATDAAITTLVDDAAASLREDQIVASGLTYATWQAHVNDMRTWAAARANYIDSQYEALPSVTPTNQLFSGSVAVTMSATDGGAVYYTTDGSDPRAHGGGIAASAMVYSAATSITARTRIIARTRDGSRWSGSVERNYYQLSDIPQLVISEIAYNPAPPSPAEQLLGYESSSDFEYIEIQNIGATTADLSPLALDGGCRFDFSAGSVPSLTPGTMTLVARNPAAFAARHGNGHNVAGTFTGTLDNAGDQLILKDALLNIDIQNFTYDDDEPWPEEADGDGFSLVLVNPAGDPDHNLAANWRASTTAEGSPGATDPVAPADSGVRINEVLTHTDLPSVDSIELLNTSTTVVDIGSWFLTDSFTAPKKFEIPAGATIPAGGYMVFDEADFNTPTNLPTRFQLSSTGDDVWLFSADAQSNLTGEIHGFEFGAAPNGFSFGRYLNTVGEEHFPLQTGLTLGTTNAGPRIGPIVISEIMYNPASQGGTNNVRNEYVELTNIAGSSVDLFNPAVPASTWRLRDAVDFDFPQGVTMDAGSRMLVVSFDPTNTTTLTAFRAAYGMDTNVPIYGPWGGRLNNSNETVALKWPDTPNIDSVPYILAEEISYASNEPWPPAADGTGKSLQRIVNSRYGNDPDNWYAAAPRPGDAPDLSIDSDSDTMKDWEEWRARTNPLDPGSHLYMGAVVAQPSGGVELTLHTVAGRRYALDCTTNLITPTFQPAAEDIIAASNRTLVTLTNTTSAARFYRLRLDP